MVASFIIFPEVSLINPDVEEGCLRLLGSSSLKLCLDTSEDPKTFSSIPCSQTLTAPCDSGTALIKGVVIPSSNHYEKQELLSYGIIDSDD